MLLGALVDAGAELTAVQQAVDATVPGAVRITVTAVTRAGLRATKVNVEPLMADPPHRTWRDIRGILGRSALSGAVRDRATAIFARLAEAEAHVHGIPVEDVHFHEVGALDSIADVVGVCAALENLGVVTVSAGEIAVGAGRVRTAHGDVPVPVPAVAELARGWRVRAGWRGELATPTGVAALRALAGCCEELPPMTVEAVGVGAGSRDTTDRANVMRVVVGVVTPAVPAEPRGESAVLLEANIDDLDPRLWPEILSGLLSCGAADAWLVPIIMKKGRPAHTLSVLCHPDKAELLRDRVFRDTTTLGVRESLSHKYPLPRAFVNVDLGGATVAIKVGYQGETIVTVMPEFDDIVALARRLGRPGRLVLQDAMAAAAAAGLLVGASFPATVRPASNA
jgi:hypothetical protein